MCKIRIFALVAILALTGRVMGHDVEPSFNRIVQLNVNARGASLQPIAYADRGMAAMEKSAGPAIEAGVQKVGVTISGNIELDAATI